MKKKEVIQYYYSMAYGSEIIVLIALTLNLILEILILFQTLLNIWLLHLLCAGNWTNILLSFTDTVNIWNIFSNIFENVWG